MKSLGICLGASTIRSVFLDINGEIIKEISKETIFHDGDSKKALIDLIRKFNTKEIDRLAITGRKFKNFINLTSITEPEAIEHAIEKLIHDKNKYNALVTAGGETILVYQLNKYGQINNVFTGNKCASGTGSFFLQQLGRMALTIDDVINKDFELDNAYPISGRCSVFCKSDCTHALNKGTPKDNVASGLCKMMATKITELLTNLDKKNLIVTGGISKVKPIMDFVSNEVDSLFIPDYSDYFEAYGASIWASKNQTTKFPGFDNLFKEEPSSFDFLKPLKEFEHLVTFKEKKRDIAKDGDICVLGVDIGSTTTKAVLMRKSDDAILASCYLRTNGDPIQASKNCYIEILKQLNGAKIKIIGLGTTGSGRHIVGLHALTNSVFNEIICHATASIYFDKDVDTIFEIGGQDAKYTYITQGIPSDYAMNEACSAGTGSFLEEAAKESLNVDVNDIGEIAIRSKNPPNFNDQCSAFISSDIRTAFQEGLSKEDIVAGLVYSICLNYNNRVRGSRPYGKKIFMQGGVCYNKAVPIAMAALLNKEIIVPPEPGLMGAFGCAYEVKKRIDNGFIEEGDFSLQELYQREISYGTPFVCNGGKEKCDRKCQINILKIKDQNIPFGGACNKYYNLKQNADYDIETLDLVALREKMIFEEFAKPSGNVNEKSKTIGINRTFLVNMLYPLYFNFWDQLGFKVVLSDDVTDEGREKRKAAFCFPAEIAHGAFDNLLTKNPDYIFMPHVMHIPVSGSVENNKACVFVQGEPYYLKQAFKDKNLPEFLVPIIDFQKHVNSTEEEFVKCAISIGIDKNNAKKAFEFASQKMEAYFKKAWRIGEETLKQLENDKDKFAFVLMGRWYNALAKEANMTIPHKVASRGIQIIPYDFLPYNVEKHNVYMHWGIGKTALQVSLRIKKHPQLFAIYVTNFSCGPDSFIVPYFRDEMGKKPSLTLELDSHTADVGLNTRIEAAIDIIKYYRQLENQIPNEKETAFQPASTFQKGTKTYFKDSKGNILDFKDENVTFLFPVMGRFLTEGGVAALKKEGFNAKMVEYPDPVSLAYGKANSGCKECLPYIVLVGSLMHYIKHHKKPGEKIAYFIVGDPAPCRVEQYQVGFKKLIEKNKIEDVAVHTLESSEGFAGMGLKPLLNVWKSMIIADIFEQIYASILTLAKDRESGIKIFDEEWQKIKDNFEGKEKISLEKRLKLTCNRFKEIEVKYPIEKAMRVTITGEMYVRNEQFCRQNIEKTLADMDLVAKITPLIEWHYYVDYVQSKNYGNEKFSIFKRIFFFMKGKIQHSIEKKIKSIFKELHLYEYDPVNVHETLEVANPLIHPKLIGDIGLTVGGGLKETLNESCGVISLGPFACLQTRTAEAILKSNMTVKDKLNVTNKSVLNEKICEIDQDMPLPYLAIESDGNPYPQIIQAQLEVFGLQAKRIGQMMLKTKEEKNLMTK